MKVKVVLTTMESILPIINDINQQTNAAVKNIIIAMIYALIFGFITLTNLFEVI